MSELPEIDPFAKLWQSAPEPDTAQLMADIRRLQKTHQWHNRVLVGILCATAGLLVFGAACVGAVGLWIAAALWIAFVAGAIGYERARCRATDALDLDTVSLLKRMIKRARRGLTQARRMYIGVPIAAGVSWIGTRVFLPHLGAGGHALAPWLAAIYTAASFAMLAGMVVAGLVLARARRLQLQELSEKLRSFEEGL